MRFDLLINLSQIKENKILENLKEYRICKANSEVWAKYHVIYRLTNFNEWMSLNLQNGMGGYIKTDCCYWITRGNERIGGAFIKPNLLECVFTIPPFHNEKELIEKLVIFVDSISDKSKPIVVPDAGIKQVDYYKSIGFNLERVDKIMICPTNEFDITWEENHKIIFPKIEHSEAMARLYFETYSNNKLPYIASQSYDFQVSSVKVYFKHIEFANVSNKWSTLVYDTNTNKFIGACLVGIFDGQPYILDFVVHPKSQGKGIASKMIKRTLNLAYKNYSALRLNVTVGNDAEVFYDKLGFIGSAEKGYLTKTAQI